MSFRIGLFQSNYQSSVYYNKSREVSTGYASLVSISEGLDTTVDGDMSSAFKA